MAGKTAQESPPRREPVTRMPAQVKHSYLNILYVNINYYELNFVGFLAHVKSSQYVQIELFFCQVQSILK